MYERRVRLRTAGTHRGARDAEAIGHPATSKYPEEGRSSCGAGRGACFVQVCPTTIGLRQDCMNSEFRPITRIDRPLVPRASCDPLKA